MYAAVFQEIKDKVKLEIKFEFYVRDNDEEGFLKSIQWLENFGGNIISVYVGMESANDRQSIEIMKRLVDHCPDLVSIFAYGNVWKDAVEYFAQMFGDWDRASNLPQAELIWRR